MKKPILALAALAALGAAGPGMARAACNIPHPDNLDTAASFDNHYANIGFPTWNSSGTSGSAYCCQQAWMDMVWDRYTYASSTWDGNMGRTDACNSNKPVGRMFHGNYALLYSARQYAQTWGDTSSGTIIQWAGTYAGRWIVATSGVCAFSSAYNAATYDTHTEYTFNVIYLKTVPERAGTMIHESVHAYGVNHNASGEKDKKYNDGPWTYHMQWQFEYAALGVRNTSTMRKRAADDASLIQNKWFVEKPFMAIYYRKADGTYQNVDCPSGCSYDTGDDLLLNDWGFISRRE